MANTQVAPFASVKLSALGAGQVGLTPPSGVMWKMQLATVSIPSPVLIPQIILSAGNSNGPLTLIDSSYAGASASSGKVSGLPLYPGQWIWAAWTGADALAVATLTVYATAVRNYRSRPG